MTREHNPRARATSDGSHAAFPSVRPMVLIVDDHSDTGDMLAEYLEFHGARAMRASCVEEAHAVLEVMSIDVLVSDYAMPGEDGLSFLRSLRGTARGAHLPVVIVSGHDHRGDIASAAVALGAHFVRKPFDLTHLVDAVQTALAKSATRKRNTGASPASRLDRETEPAPPRTPKRTASGPRPRARGVVEVVTPRPAADPRVEPDHD